MQIRTTLAEDGFSHSLAGLWSKNIHNWLKKRTQSIWAIYMPINLPCFRRSKISNICIAVAFPALNNQFSVLIDSIQFRYYWTLTLLISVILPTFMLCYCFGESLSAAWHFGFCFRHIYILNGIFLVNSYAHAVGTRPYDKGIRPTENRLLSIITHGEGWHNYHHAFPWDYKAAELGNYRYNFSTGFIDFFAKIGWAYDLKTVSEDTIRKRMARSGDLDLTYSNIKSDDLKQECANRDNIDYKQHNDGVVKHVWGWNDPDNEELKKDVTYLHKKRWDCIAAWEVEGSFQYRFISVSHIRTWIAGKTKTR